MLIHATITVSGERSELDACAALLGELLSGQLAAGEATEQHGPRALCYDLKVEGGIPFPAFAHASQRFPGLTFEAEWVNPDAGERCCVTLVNGRATRQSSERLSKG